MVMTLLQVTPDKVIEFPEAPSSVAVGVDLRLKNVSDSPVAYKIKTTAPRNYLVRPSSGVLDSKGEQVVRIVLQPVSQTPSAAAAAAASGTTVVSNDRFLVQATEVEFAEQEIGREFWTNLTKDKIQEQRLSVTYNKAAAAAAGSSSSSSREGYPPTAAAAASAPPSGMAASVGGTAAAAGSTGGVSAGEARRPPGGPPPASAEFEMKYNDLLQYCLALEKQKTALTKENEALKALKSGGGVAAHRGHTGFELWQVISIVIGVVILLKVVSIL